MNKQIKAVAVLATAAVLTIGTAISAIAAYSGWVEKSGKWYYYNQDGSKVTSEWVQSGNDWYWINTTGYASMSRWVEYDGRIYYMLEDGRMATNCFKQYKKTTYYLGENGYAVSNRWIYDNYKWYYMDENCKLTIGLKEIDGTFYYFDGNGVMCTNVITAGYYFGMDGRAVVIEENSQAETAEAIETVEATETSAAGVVVVQ